MSKRTTALLCRTTLYRTAAILSCAGAAALILGAPAATTVKAAGGAPISIKATELAPGPNPSTAFNRMVEAMGLFAKHGLKYEHGPKLGGGGPARVQAVVTGNSDVATGDIIAALGGIYSGAKVKVIMVMTPYGDEQIWAQNQYKTMKDATGKSWAVASLGGAQRFNCQMAVQGMGLDPNAFRWVAIPGGDGPHLQALSTGRVQIASLSHLGATLAHAKGYDKKIHVVVQHTAKYTPPIPRLVIVATADWLKQHEDAATRYVEMMLDASRQWQTNSKSWTTAAEKIYKKSGLNAEEMKDAWQEFRDGGYFSVNGGINFAATEKVMDLFFKFRHESPNQYLSKPSDLYDTGPLKRALDKMGVFKGTMSLPDNPDWYKGKGGHAG